MIRTLAFSAVAAVGMMLMPGQSVPAAAAAPTIAPRLAAPESTVELVRRGGRGFSRGYSGRSFAYRGGRGYYGGSFYRRSFRGGRYYAYPRHYRYRYGRYYRPGIVIGAGLPFFYSGYGYYSGCGYYHRKWQRTGSRYWRSRYYACRW